MEKQVSFLFLERLPFDKVSSGPKLNLMREIWGRTEERRKGERRYGIFLMSDPGRPPGAMGLRPWVNWRTLPYFLK